MAAAQVQKVWLVRQLTIASLFLTLFNVRRTHLAGRGLSEEYTYFLQPRELLTFYKTWEIISYEESYSLSNLKPYIL